MPNLVDESLCYCGEIVLIMKGTEGPEYEERVWKARLGQEKA